MENKNNPWFDTLKQKANSLSHLLVTVAAWIIDVLNTTTPPWFEIHIISEIIRIWNIDTIISFLKNELEKEIQRSKLEPWIIESKIIFWSQMERWTLWSRVDRYEELMRLRESNWGRQVGFI